MHRESKFGIPVFPLESRGNGNGHGVYDSGTGMHAIEMGNVIHGNGKKCELTTDGKIPTSTTVSIVSIAKSTRKISGVR